MILSLNIFDFTRQWLFSTAGGPTLKSLNSTEALMLQWIVTTHAQTQYCMSAISQHHTHICSRQLPLDSSKQPTPRYNEAHYCLKLNIDWMNKHLAQPQAFKQTCETVWAARVGGGLGAIKAIGNLLNIWPNPMMLASGKSNQNSCDLWPQYALSC